MEGIDGLYTALTKMRRKATKALRVVAGYDPDRAALDNGIGFARSDVALGHALASSSSMSALASPGTALMVWRLAMRYRRQVSPRLNLLSGFTDQSDLFDSALRLSTRRRRHRSLVDMASAMDLVRIGMGGGSRGYTRTDGCRRSP